jgi:hypothetical protein
MPTFEGHGHPTTPIAQKKPPIEGTYRYVPLERTGTFHASLRMTIARRDHRKSKFGLRHRIKLIELYTVTKSEF